MSEEIVKRGPGRPRKHPLPDSVFTTPEPTIPVDADIVIEELPTIVHRCPVRGCNYEEVERAKSYSRRFCAKCLMLMTVKVRS